MTSVRWLLNDGRLDAKKMMALGVLDSLLLGTSVAPLRKALTQSWARESWAADSIYELVQNTFSVGMKGVKPEDAAKVQQLVFETLTAW